MGEVGAVIIAAGNSTRMGGNPKALLPLLQESVLERLIGLFEANGVTKTGIVLGDHSPLISPLLHHLQIPWVSNPAPENGMFSSIQLGVEELPENISSFFILPVDVPLIPIDLPQKLMALQAETKAPIAAPSINQRRGHPPLFDGTLRQEILDFSGDGGLRAFQKKYLDKTAWLLIESEDVLLDMDTPEDYKLISNRAKELDYIPTAAEVESFLIEHECDDNRRAHCLAVSKMALELLEKIKAAKPEAKVCKELPAKQLLQAAALIHDVAKGGRGHDKKGAAWARSKGWHSVAALVRSHMNLLLPEQPVLDGRALLFLADKVVKRDQVVGIERNFAESLQKFVNNKYANAAIKRRIAAAKKVLDLVEEIVGPLPELH